MTTKQTTLTQPNKLYRIPIDQREIYVSTDHWALSKFHVTDNIGFVLYYEEGQDLTDDFIRHHLVMMKCCFEYVIASSQEKAIAILSKKLEGLSIGGTSVKAKAQQIMVEKIQEIPLCPRLKKATKGAYKGEWMCHMLNNDGTQDKECIGGCMFSNYDAMEDCPIKY